MHTLSATKRCGLFEDIAIYIWHKLIASINANIAPSEIGITKDIITTIRNNVASIPNLGVWANPSHNESINGNDIDIFVETLPGHFVWYALQAKVLGVNHAYNDMNKKKGGEYQWEKLKRLSANSRNCTPYYLLYNGVKKHKYASQDTCNNDFDETQFGCSIATIRAVENICSNVTTPHFDDFHPNVAQPWRILVCCYQKKSNFRTYTAQQIKKAVDYYPEKTNADIIEGDDVDDNQATTRDNINIINQISADAGWKPYYRVVIRTTASL